MQYSGISRKQKIPQRTCYSPLLRFYNMSKGPCPLYILLKDTEVLFLSLLYLSLSLSLSLCLSVSLSLSLSLSVCGVCMCMCFTVLLSELKELWTSCVIQLCYFVKYHPIRAWLLFTSLTEQWEGQESSTEHQAIPYHQLHATLL